MCGGGDGNWEGKVVISMCVLEPPTKLVGVWIL